MPNDEVVMENAISAQGLRRMEIVRLGSAPDRSKWIPYLSPTCLATIESWSWQEEGMDMHHLVMVWNAREVVELRMADKSKGLAVMWWIGKDSFRQAATDAAAVHRIDLGVDGCVCFTAKLPKNAPLRADGQPENLRLQVIDQEIEMPIQDEGWWVPRGYLVIGGPWLKQ